MSFYICKVIGSFCFSLPAWHKLRLCYTRPMAAKLTDNKTLFCHSDDRKNLIKSRPAQWCSTVAFNLYAVFFYSFCSLSPCPFGRKKDEKRPAHSFFINMLGYARRKSSNKFSFSSLAQAFESRSKLLLVSYKQHHSSAFRLPLLS